MRYPLLAIAPLLLACALGCAAAPPSPRRPELVLAIMPPPEPTSAQRFGAVLASMARHDAAGDWTDETCALTAKQLLATGKNRPALARHDAALVYLRCGRRAEAIALFESALSADPDLAQARLALTLARAANARNSRDFSGAKALLGEALRRDERSAPALNELALVHLAAASSAPRPATARLELARAVAARAVALDPTDAPSHHTLGRIDLGLHDHARAVASFERARRLDPRLFEAHASLADARLHLGDFVSAEEAYRAALRVRPADYDARLGLAAALRGQLDGVDPAAFDARVAAAREGVDATIALAPERPEAYLSAAILAQDHGARAGGSGAERELLRAREMFQRFVKMAGSTPALARQKELAEERLEGIRGATECEFGVRESKRRELEVQRKTREAEEEANGP